MLTGAEAVSWFQLFEIIKSLQLLGIHTRLQIEFARDTAAVALSIIRSIIPEAERENQSGVNRKSQSAFHS